MTDNPSKISHGRDMSRIAVDVQNEKRFEVGLKEGRYEVVGDKRYARRPTPEVPTSGPETLRPAGPRMTPTMESDGSSPVVQDRPYSPPGQMPVQHYTQRMGTLEERLRKQKGTNLDLA